METAVMETAVVETAVMETAMSGTESLGLEWLVTLSLFVLGLVVGRVLEGKHLQDLRRREQKLRSLPVVTLRKTPTSWQVNNARMVTGSVVISIDYFKRIASSIRGIFGGRIRSLEPLMDRARREAILRLREQAASQGDDVIIHLRLETSTLASGGGNNKQTAGVEVLAYGTALRLEAGWQQCIPRPPPAGAAP